MRKFFSLGMVIAFFLSHPTAQEHRITRYDVSALPLIEVNANLRIKKVIGEIGTFMLGGFSPGFKSANLHHHTHEQVNVGISGEIDILGTGSRYKLTNSVSLFWPPDVPHGVDASAAVAPHFIEFQPVRRVDMPPQSEKVVFPMADAARPLPDGWRVDEGLGPGSGNWESLSNGVKVKARRGKLVAVSAWEVPPSAREFFDLRLHVPGAEQFVYVLSGQLDAKAANVSSTASAGVLLLNPPNSRPIQVRAGASSASTILVFEAAQVSARSVQ